MRTAIGTSDYYVGGETFINRHIELLFGGDTVVVCGRSNGEDPYDKPIFERRAPLGGMDLLSLPFWTLWNRAQHATSRVPFGQAKRDLADFLRRERVEVILAEFGTQALALAPLANELEIPIFSYYRGTDASKALRARKIQVAYRKMMPRLAGVFSVSQFLLDNLARHGVRHDNAHVIPSGVDVRRFFPTDKDPLSCLAVGRFVEKKAPLITLRSFAEATVGTGARLDFIGDGPLLAPARALADELGVADRVTFHGAQKHDFVREILQRTQFFLQHSVTAADGNTEGLPTAIQEAMACGCITVSTRHAGIPEAIDEGETGFLVEEHDASGFTRAIRTALTADNLAQMSAKARSTAEERFDNDILLHRLEAQIRMTLGR
ncbi:glycosyltransferase [Puniceibacterium sediminis]|uniref:Glycosyltransferase involved in cell wall bisynthesis n=1 Tax=Puniceibacterium sediminis TaxID=1608407 RepID=A0A238WXA8_9RHOB|nr:glycosyltransferase [Puniceibacterium sediminis]SNR50981.1 Glycosyltransferase involved in cell wall bisynthesis [Puniceibacterium sediminis]